MTTSISDRFIVRRLWQSLRPFLSLFLLSTLLYLPVTGFLLLQPLVIGHVVDRGLVPRDISQVWLFASLYLLLVVGHIIFEAWQLFSLQKLGQKLVLNLRKQVFAKIQRLPLRVFDQTPMGAISTRITSDAEAVSELFSSGSAQIIGDLLFIVGTLMMLFIVDMSLSLGVIVVLPVLAIGIYFFRRWTKQAYVWVRKQLASLNTFLYEYLAGMTTVQLTNQIDRASKKFDEENIEYMLANRRAVFLDATIYSFVDAVSYLSVALVLWEGAKLFSLGALPLGVMVVFVEALSRFFQPIREFSSKYALFQSAMVAGGRIFEFLDQPEEHFDQTQKRDVVFRHTLSFENVSFAYREQQVLSDVAFTIHRHERIALMGHTGAGKSTITKLLLRLYPVTAGKILLDGVPIDEFNLDAWRRLFNVVPQEVFLFSGTLRDNLIYGRRDVDDNTVLKALASCQADYLLERPGGINTIVESRGRNFSLGERQLIALARALIADPEILILDEATANVDPITEHRLQLATAQAMQNRTCLIVAHRLNTVQSCDRILVFHQGRLQEQGTHDELLARQGMYASMATFSFF